MRTANAADATQWRHPAASAAGNLRWTFTPKDSAPSGRPSEPLPQRRPPTSIEDTLVGQPFPQQRPHPHAAEARHGATEKTIESRAATLSGLWHPQASSPLVDSIRRSGPEPDGASQARRHPPDENRVPRLYHGEARSMSLNFGLAGGHHEAPAADHRGGGSATPADNHTGEAHGNISAAKARSIMPEVGPRGTNTGVGGASGMLASFPSRQAPALGGLSERRGSGTGIGEEQPTRHFSRRPAEEPSTQRPRLNEASSTVAPSGSSTGGVARRSIDALSSPTFIGGDGAGVSGGRASVQGLGQTLPRSSPSAPPSAHSRAENAPQPHVEATPHPHTAHAPAASPPAASQPTASPPAASQSVASSPAPVQAQSTGEDVAYLKRNMEHLCSEKHRLESQVQDLEARVHGLEQRKQQYKMLYEQVRSDTQNMGSGELEMMSLHQQLSAVLMLKEALNTENLELRTRLEAAQKSHSAESRQAACVICMDNLANVVCLPCKHLALCSYCTLQQEVSDCPICRTGIKEQMQVYTP